VSKYFILIPVTVSVTLYVCCQHHTNAHWNNGFVAKAARYFSQLLDRKVLESTMRRLKSEYIQRVKAIAATSGDDSENAALVVKALPTKTQGRPLLLGQELDKDVKDYISAMRTVGGVVNMAIVMAAAEGIISARNVTKLSSHGGHIHITKTWAKSLLKRMGYVKRKSSTLERSPPHTSKRSKRHL